MNISNKLKETCEFGDIEVGKCFMYPSDVNADKPEIIIKMSSLADHIDRMQHNACILNDGISVSVTSHTVVVSIEANVVIL